MNPLHEPAVAYVPAFLKRVRERALAIVPVQVVFSGADAEMLRSEADERNVTPMVLAKAILAKVRTDGLLGAVLDGVNPQSCAAGQARGVEGLTLIQSAVLMTLAQHRDERGICRLSHDKIGIICADTAQSTVGAALGALRRDGLIQRDATEKNQKKPAWRLTADGQRMFLSLAGEGQ